MIFPTIWWHILSQPLAKKCKNPNKIAYLIS
jgi:hypothetical protein